MSDTPTPQTGVAETGIAQIGKPESRIDGRLKVTGQARYASDMPVADPAYAFLVTSNIARGRIRQIDTTAARAVPGVLDILTWENVNGAIKPQKLFSLGGYMQTSIRPLGEPEVRHDGEIVAIVLANTFEAARQGGWAVDIAYDRQTPSATFGNPGTTTEEGQRAGKPYDAPKVGDADAAFAAAPVKIEATYFTPTQHHNPIELFTTTCVWEGERLTVYEPSQTMWGLKNGVAAQLGIDPSRVRTVSEFVGGAFGSKGSTTPRTALIALAAQRLRRPVKLVPTREQAFTIVSYRAETRQHVQLAADRTGKLQALVHEGWEVSSRPDPYCVLGTETTARMYACPNVRTGVQIVHADRNTPGFMRSPPELPYMFGLESAMDELAIALNIDPVELRRINDTQKEPIHGIPYSSRSLMQCFDAAASRFGWSGRKPAPRSMRDGDWLVGWGCATSCYPTHIAPATARVRLTPDGHVRVQTAGHEIGTGAYTAYGMIAAHKLGVPLHKVHVELGDSELPPAPVAGGSNSTASIGNCIASACEDIRVRIARAAVLANDGVFAGQDPNTLTLAGGALRGPDGRGEELSQAMRRAAAGVIEAYAETKPEGTPKDAVDRLYHGRVAMTGGSEGKKYMMYAFGAVFVEVRVNAYTNEVRVPRVVGAFAAGRIVNPKAAQSQLMGGMIWGISAALHEATEIDPREARYVNANLADYLVPVCADIQQVDVIMVPEHDPHVNALGIKGIGELGDVGTNAAVANAVYHATGVRVRELPIRLEKLST